MFCVILTVFFLLSHKKFFEFALIPQSQYFEIFLLSLSAKCLDDLKDVILPSKDSFFMRHSFTEVRDSFTKVQVILKFLVIRNMYSQHFYTLTSIPPDATFTFFRTLILSHLSKFGHSPEKFKIGVISFKAFFTEVSLFKKDAV